MSDDEARLFLHDNLYTPLFANRAAASGVRFGTADEIVGAQQTTLRLKQAMAARQNARSRAAAYGKRAVYAQMNKMASNVLRPGVNPQTALAQQIAADPRFAPYLDALDI